MAVNKVVYGTTVLVDLTADTVTADKLMQGYTAHDRSGALITGIATGGSGDTYTLTTIVPQQTFTVSDSEHQAILTSTGGFEDGELYLITFDGGEYASPCELLWGADYCVGDINPFMGNYAADNVFPVGMIWENSVMYVATRDTNQHTVKVERLEFVDGPLNLIAKSVTANGTYSASSDNADGYSSVTVNVAGGSETYRLDNIVPEQTVACTTLLMNNAYFGFIQNGTTVDNSEQYLVTFDGTEYVCEGYVPEANSSGVGDIRVTQTNAAQYLIAPFFIEYENASGDYYFVVRGSGTHTIKVDKLTFIDDGETFQTKTVTPTTSQQTVQPDSGYDGLSQVTVNAIPSEYIVPSGNKAITQNGNNIDVAEYATVSVNVSGSSMNVQVAQSTTRVANTAYTKTASLTCSKTGTYDVYWDCFRSSTSGTSGSQLYIGGTASGSANTTFSNHAQNNHRTGVQINANQEVAVYVRSRATNYYAYCGQLTIVQTA